MDDTQNDGTAADELLAAIEQSDESANEETTNDADGAEGGDEDAGSERETSALDALDGVDGEDGEDGDDEEGEDEGKRSKRSGSARLRAQVARLTAQLNTRRAAVANDEASIAAAVSKEVGEPPKEADFAGDFAAFDRAQTAYEVDKRSVERRVRTDAAAAAEDAKAASVEHFENLTAAHMKRLDRLEKALPGAREAIRGMKKVEIADTVGELLLESPKSDLLALYFAKNPNKLVELNGLSERAATREITRLESRLSLKQPRTETRAGAPLRPLTGGTKPSVDPSKMSNAAYRAWRSKNAGR